MNEKELAPEQLRWQMIRWQSAALSQGEERGQKNRVLEQNPPSHSHQTRGEKDNSHIPAVFTSQGLQLIGEKSYKVVIELSGGHTVV